ncbi:hypothetical protein [Aquimarina muelleri]|uniref:Uncharacterized protein n=2 Tax=Aquimarina muelleri TaxID=279356 RepID=A0A918JY86_9FLAO|nr:hypothetical protein [Aquimarina muelleri]GGX36409.1 hypothetical protein GCM10007384_39840 [Aquimarina muelleri]
MENKFIVKTSPEISKNLTINILSKYNTGEEEFFTFFEKGKEYKINNTKDVETYLFYLNYKDSLYISKISGKNPTNFRFLYVKEISIIEKNENLFATFLLYEDEKNENLHQYKLIPRDSIKNELKKFNSIKKSNWRH